MLLGNKKKFKLKGKQAWQDKAGDVDVTGIVFLESDAGEATTPVAAVNTPCSREIFGEGKTNTA